VIRGSARRSARSPTQRGLGSGVSSSVAPPR
jgi:hypothetical protein